MGGREIAGLSAAALGRAYRAGTLSPREVTGALLEVIAEGDGALNAFCIVAGERALSQAAASERRFVTRSPLGPLDGIPVAIKDLLLTREWPTRRGSRVLQATQHGVDSPAVVRLREQGAVLMGKTTTPEIGWKAVTDSPLHGVTRNPFDTAYSAGGSSGGSAAAVAAGMVPLALGTDGGGSIRIPAALCGIVGLKPTYGRVAQWPQSAFVDVAHAGPMARTVEDATLLLQAIAGPHPLDPLSLPAGDTLGAPARRDLAGVRIAFSANLGFAAVDDQVARALAAAVEVLAALGAEVRPADPGFPEPIAAFETIWYAGAARALAGVSEERRALMDPGLVEIAALGAATSATAYLAAREECTQVALALERVFERHDLLVTPALPILGVPAGEEVPPGWHARRWPSWTPFTYPFNMSRHPALALFCGQSRGGLPIGMQIVAPRFSEARLLSAASAFEAAVPPVRPPACVAER